MGGTGMTGTPTSQLLQRELDEAHKTIRSLLRQLNKEQQRHAEIVRAYNLTVGNLMEMSRRNAELERERDRLRAQLTHRRPSVTVNGVLFDLTLPEIGAIRRAMARLHHPDTGGNSERLRVWNVTLDELERASLE
jgi:hypothetical protein